MQTMQNRRRAALGWRSRTDLHPDVVGGAASAPGSSGCGRTRPRRSRPPGPGRRSSPPAPRRASRCASTCRRSTCSAATRRARALYLYPAKALAQDQARALHALGVKHARPAIYDGDTPREQRSAIRRRANLVLTNPDMLHLGILPNHGAWGDFFANLAVVVVDEAHVYRGVFGSHVANVLRRLRRVADAYGTEPRFLLASATIANPGELAERLTGLERRHGDRPRRLARAPRARSRCGTRRSSTRRSPRAARRSAEAADLLAELVIEGARTIVFMKSRKAVELIARFAVARRCADRGRPELAERIAPYRAGYTPQQRRELEHRLVDGRAARRRVDRRARARHRHRLARRGDLRDVPGHGRLAAPDVGPRGAARPRAGGLRRGRGRARPVLLPPPRRVPRPAGRGGDPRPRERADPRRAPAVRRARGAAGAGRRRDARAALARTTARALEAAGDLRRRPDGTLRPAPPGGVPGGARSRCARPSRDAVAIVDVDSGELLGNVDFARAFTTVHEGAVYLHGGRAFEVTRARPRRAPRARRSRSTGDWYTQPKRETDTLDRAR